MGALALCVASGLMACSSVRGDDDAASSPGGTPPASATAGVTAGANGTAVAGGATSAPPAATTAAPAAPVTFTLVTAGDVLPHATVNRNAQLPDGTYDYAPLMVNVRPFIEYADLALCSLEVPLAPVGEAVTAYPVFGAPDALISSLAEVGWDGCATATNHALDRGRPGLTHTLDVMDEVGLGHAGTGRTPEETVSAQFYEVTKDGVTLTIAHLSATTFHNDYTDPSQYSDVLHALDPAEITAQAAAARAAGADIVLVTPHWGQEYWLEPDDLQLQIAADIAAGGQVDVLLGGHSHTAQDLVRYDGGVDGEGMWVAYSMGNFLSNQDEICCVMQTATGLILQTTIDLDPATGDAHVTGVTWSGVTADTQSGQVVQRIEEVAASGPPAGSQLTTAQIDDRFADLVAQMGEQDHHADPPAPAGAVVTVVPRTDS